ncbi:MAG TPA: DUF2252 domain-containing protein [Solirubrobacterales bacterium]|nr:DUF2252 domain-containing protein [Solirubrobacterales bacterium]
MVDSIQSHPGSPDERAAAGKAARTAALRSSHGEWQPTADRADPVELLQHQAGSRVGQLVPLRYGRMLASPFTFYRGAAAVMAADLASTPCSGFETQLCGDAHLSNFGAFASPERRLVFDLNDFDETLPGPWEWDLKRLVASFSLAGRDRGCGGGECRGIVLAAAREYRETMRRLARMGNLESWYQQLDADAIAAGWASAVGGKQRKAFERNVAKAKAKDSDRAFSKLVEEVDGKLRIVSNPPLIVPIEELAEQAKGADIEALVRHVLSEYRDSLPVERRSLIDGYRLIDVAFKVVGVGSVGTRAWIALLLGRDRRDPLFLQIKEAQRSVLEPYTAPSDFDLQGERVVHGQRLMQAASDTLLGWVRSPGIDGEQRDFYVRQLWDWKGSVQVDAMDARGLTAYAEICGMTLAHAHARGGDRIAIGSYLGKGDTFDRALAEFSESYADQNERDYEALRRGVDEGRVEADVGRASS